MAGGASVSGLQAQLDRYQQQLSDCVNCATANTIEGKQTIQDLSGRISAIKARIEQVEADKAVQASASARQTTQAGTADTSDSSRITSAPEMQTLTTATPSNPSGFALTHQGTRLDVYA